MPQTMSASDIFTTLLQQLRGGGFNTSLTVNGFDITGQKVIAFENGVVYTVGANGVARATNIAAIQSVDF